MNEGKFGNNFFGGLIEVGFTARIQPNLHIWSSLNISRRVFLHLKYNQFAFWTFLMLWIQRHIFRFSFHESFFLWGWGGGSWKPYWFYWVFFLPLFDNPYYLKYLVPPCEISSHWYSPIVMGGGGDYGWFSLDNNFSYW